MKKLVMKIPLMLAFGAMLITGGIMAKEPPLLKANALTPPDGDLLGAAKVSFKKSSETDILATFKLDASGEGGANYSGAGIYLRMKNYTGTNTYINMKLQASNGEMRGPKRGVQHTYYNTSGTEVTFPDIELREYANYLILPANFDGFIYMNYENQMAATDDTPGTRTFRYTAVTTIFEISAKYDSYANFAIGDVYTDTRSIIDTSEIAVSAFSGRFVNQSEEYLNIEQLSRSGEFEPRGDLLGSINVKTPNSGGGFHVFADGKSIGTGAYVRMRNNSANENQLLTHVNSRNNGRVTNTPGATYYTYDSEGLNKTAHTFNDVNGGQLTVPGNFNGYIFLPIASYSHNTVYSSEEFVPSDIFAVYFEGVMTNLDFGDIFTEDVIIYDGSEYYPADLNSHVAVDWDCTITLNEGHLIPVVPEFEYGDVNYVSDLEQGAQITCNRDTENNTIATVNINLPTVSDFSSGLAITVRIKGIAGDFPFFFNVIDENGNVSEMPDNSSEKKVKYVSLDGTVRNASSGGNNHAIKYPNGFDGNLVIPVDLLSNKTASGANLARVAKFEIGIAVFYDYDFNAVFGDIGYIIEENKAHVIVLDTSEATFTSVFTKGDAPDYTNIKKYYPPAACSWIGDVKVLNPLKYASDTALKQEVVWDAGDNACSYSVMDDGMFVHIGPYETGHTYGSYMCLQIDEKGVYTDRKVWSREVDGHKELAKGITAYVKNLSRKEIGITLQIDEFTEQSTYERWCIKGYPAMYYAWDVNTNAEYSFYCKSDQFQIPVGFEGYVRIPFESYRVPDWCQPTPGVDNILDIERWSGKFYLTSDNTRFEDLEYFIKNIGVYFNHTENGSMFDHSHSIRTNMGL